MSLNNSERLGQNATTESSEAPRAGQAFARRPCDGEGRMSFAAEADSCIGRRVLDENRRFYRSCKASKMIDVLRMHMCRMSIAVFRLHR